MRSRELPSKAVVDTQYTLAKVVLYKARSRGYTEGYAACSEARICARLPKPSGKQSNKIPYLS